VRAVLIGLGAVGRRVATELARQPTLESLSVVHRDHSRAARLTEGLGERVTLFAPSRLAIPADTDVVVLAAPGAAASLARTALEAGAHVIAAIDDPHDVRNLLDLGPTAAAAGRSLAVATTMAPGLTCVLAAYGAARLDTVEQVHVASFGTGGPACARRHHAALASASTDWYDGVWRRRPGGSGRELVWFPEPVGGADCYRARLVDPLLLQPAFPAATRITARLAATRRDRLTAPLPMLRPPHPEGTLGAARVELRGWTSGRSTSLVLGCSGRPALIAGTVAALSARWAVEGRLRSGNAGGLAALVEHPGVFLGELQDRGIALSVFEGLSPGARAAAAGS